MEDIIHIHPDPLAGVSVMQAANLNNRALQLSNQGDYAGSERLHLEALNLKLNSIGEHETTTAITRNALGELYLKMGRVADAEEQLKKAIFCPPEQRPAYDAAVSIDNLGQVYEKQGDFSEARRVRLSHPEDIMVCGNYHCPGQTFNRSQLSACSGCRSVFYCVRERTGALVTRACAKGSVDLDSTDSFS